MVHYPAIVTEGRILMGPGPSNVHPRVLQAMGMPVIGHLDREFLEIMNRTKDLLAKTFETANEFTIPISGTGSAGMETSLVNFIEPGDRVLVCINGLFGQRMADIVERCGGDLEVVEAEWGRIIEPDQVEQALAKRPAKIVSIVHAETSTGVLQPIKPIADIAHKHGAILVVDAVTSLAGAAGSGRRIRHGCVPQRHSEVPVMPLQGCPRSPLAPAQPRFLMRGRPGCSAGTWISPCSTATGAKRDSTTIQLPST